MKEVRKKSADAAVNKMLMKAYRSQKELAWDRADAQQPQCGFGRLGICCTDCGDGPCRVNPFGGKAQATVCGRTQADLIAHRFLGQAADGVRALVRLAGDFGGEVDHQMLSAAYSMDSMLAPNSDKRLTELGKTAVKALDTIGAVKEAVYGKPQPAMTAANLGSLAKDAVNIVLHGHVAPQLVKELATAAKVFGETVNLTAMCGSEASGSMTLPVLTNYVSQEAPLLTGAVDLLVVGDQCVMPSVLALAGEMQVPVVDAASKQSAEQVLAAACKAFQRRAGRGVDIPEQQAEIAAGYTLENSPELLPALMKGYAQGVVRGIVYLGGCGNLVNTQDAQFVQLAGNLLADGYLLATAGCAGAALAKAGLCSSKSPVGEGLRQLLPDGMPPVLYLGPCHDAGKFLPIAQAAAAGGLPVFAVMTETVHNKVLATAIGFAAAGITTFLDLGELDLAGLSFGGRLLPLGDFRQLPQVMAEVAAAK